MNIIFMALLSSGTKTAQSQTSTSVDNWGHLGGFISGLILGLYFIDPLFQSNYASTCKIIGGIVSLLYFLINIIALFYGN